MWLKLSGCTLAMRTDVASCLHPKALVAAIRRRAQHTANFVDALEAKYGGGGQRLSKRPTAEDGSGPAASPKKPNKRGGSSKKTPGA